jgi:hypothetical protein
MGAKPSWQDKQYCLGAGKSSKSFVCILLIVCELPIVLFIGSMVIVVEFVFL